MFKTDNLGCVNFYKWSRQMFLGCVNLQKNNYRHNIKLNIYWIEVYNSSQSSLTWLFRFLFLIILVWSGLKEKFHFMMRCLHHLISNFFQCFSMYSEVVTQVVSNYMALERHCNSKTVHQRYPLNFEIGCDELMIGVNSNF